MRAKYTNEINEQQISMSLIISAFFASRMKCEFRVPRICVWKNWMENVWLTIGWWLACHRRTRVANVSVRCATETEQLLTVDASISIFDSTNYYRAANIQIDTNGRQRVRHLIDSLWCWRTHHTCARTRIAFVGEFSGKWSIQCLRFVQLRTIE